MPIGHKTNGDIVTDTDWNEVVDGINANTTAIAAVPQAWPVGSIFISAVSTNPNTLLGYGTWIAFGTGKTLVGLNALDADFDTVEETGGAKTHTHTIPGLSVPALDQVGGSTYRMGMASDGTVVTSTDSGSSWAFHATGGLGGGPSGMEAASADANTGTGTTGTGTTGSTSNMPPYITVYMWKRTA